MKIETLLYDKLDGNKTQCNICQRKCVILDGNRGFCLTRENNNGNLYNLNYGSVSSSGVDPIEKKPLFHFLPGSKVYSLGTVGCNLACKQCQNWRIARATVDSIYTQEISPETSIKLAQEYRCKSIAWTYNEPTMWLEYTLDSAKLAHKNDLKTIYVTNGYMTQESLELIGPYMDAANVDLKGMSDKFYREICNARLGPVLENIILMKEMGIHIEITNLIIPGYNDSEEELKVLVKFIVEEVGVEVPLHFTRFFPNYKMEDVNPTPIATLINARKMARDEGMRNVYVGNAPGLDGENTYCYNCGQLLIERNGYGLGPIKIDENKKCSECGAKINIKI
ncbi:MAG: AmmeMemoRadiSam system radical SAM enzyme [Methanobacteriaceae archaeon]|jgi:pyruvate formate lyase activating enzyme|nr:AmmeMemoRadiSam system radical SAM enzyme [Methanobacteriaceae archaeon]MDP2836262.1 AmmeMemoRadiSam system radical SAM enzyme [Methanobacteriaceae archaeon]MDP3033709.1 AmmeMemoRadiSam system radical SAM enzyme [Methanobacteriaceae archaeon]MDP3484939.1 AmmeMemoRadiSam system radical SAM enzyme [Methanobacteriaceae archaeon]MDP3624051.1 AmmeMemoRadiSam system radical SAM enzyme [Methanobacteriaceae archaeon]